ncbi:hypothetical protein ACFVUS_23325 [Nocardia sp. NPDC058058]|uniref:hypothetical protein n=1 Tax=Nocardia sp. NPDC058058 TaxID=3346317 RepID=UPI0036D94B51
MPDNLAGGTNVSGGTFIGSPVGGSGHTSAIQGPVTVHTGMDSEQLVTVLAQLRSELDRLRAQLPATAGPDAHPDEVADLIEELDRPEPNVARAASKWERLARRIPPALRSVEGISRIVTLFGQVQELTS